MSEGATIHTRHNITKEGTEIMLNLIKIAFFLALFGGVLWNLTYYGSVVGVLPNVDASNLSIYLVSIFGIGLFIIVVFVFSFILPGLFLRSAAREKPELGKWLDAKTQNVYNGHLIFILFSLIVGLIIAYGQDVRQPWLWCLIVLAFLTICAIAGLLFYQFYKSKMPGKSSLLMSAVFYLFLPVMFTIRVCTNAGSSSDSFIVVITTFIATLALAAVINGQIAVKGIGFASKTGTPVIKTIVTLSTVAFIILLFISQAFISKPNPFLIAPYKMLGIGFVDVMFVVEKTYAKELENIGIKPFIEPNQQTDKIVNVLNKRNNQKQHSMFYFTMLNGLGKEYIVKTNNDRKIIIPKDKVFLVEYIDTAPGKGTVRVQTENSK